MIIFILQALSFANDIPDLSGTWLLDRRENLKNYLISRGETNSLKHSAIKCIKPQMEIHQKDNNFSIKTNLKPCIPLAPVKTIHREFMADGKTTFEGKMFEGQTVSWVAWFNESKFIVKAKTPKGTEMITRTIQNNELVQRNWLIDKNVVLVQYFKKVK